MKKVRILLMLLVISAVTMNCFIVKANTNTRIIKDKDWNFSVSNNASATFESTDSSSFEVNMSSIGSSEWDVKVSMDSISLRAGETYIYEADITSNKRRDSIFVQMYDDSGNLLYTNSLINLQANTTNKVKKIFKAKKDYDNVTIAYGFGYNNYEAGITAPNSANTIKVENISLKNIKDFDYSTLEYTSIPKSTLSGYENYSYNMMSNVFLVNPESRADFGIDTICVNITTAAVSSTSGLYEMYLNGVKTQPYALEIGVWYHLDYTRLIYEYNVIQTIATDGEIAVVVIKNGNVTNHRNLKLAEISAYEVTATTDGVKEVIKDAKEDLEKATTITEIDEVAQQSKEKILELIENQEAVIKEIKSLVKEDSSDIIKNMLEKAIEKINEATTEKEIIKIAGDFMENLSLQIAKEEAIKSLTDYVGNEFSDAIKLIYEETIDNVNSAEEVEEINDIVEQAKKDVDFQIAKENAITILTTYIEEYSNDTIKEIYEDAINNINNARTVEEINDIVEQAKKDIDLQKPVVEETPEIPLTFDNILIYILMLVSSIAIIVVLKKKMILKKST